MLRTLKDLFDSLTAAEPAAPDEHTLQLATAVLLVEVMRADTALDAVERRVVVDSLRDKFALADDELARLVELAERTSREATDLYRFTSCINQRFGMEHKLRMIEAMWRVAFADGELSAHENHLMRRIADLLHIPHGAYVSAKARARSAARP